MRGGSSPLDSAPGPPARRLRPRPPRRAPPARTPRGPDAAPPREEPPCAPKQSHRPVGPPPGVPHRPPEVQVAATHRVGRETWGRDHRRELARELNSDPLIRVEGVHPFVLRYGDGLVALAGDRRRRALDHPPARPPSRRDGP